MKRANLYLTTKKDIVLVQQNPNEGWVFCLFVLQTDDKIRILNTSHTNMSREFRDTIKELFPKATGFSHSIFPHRPTAPKFALEKDISKMVIAYDYTPYEPADLDTNAVLLQDYVDSINAQSLTCEEYKNTTRAKLLKKRDMVGHNPWGSQDLNQNALGIYESPMVETNPLYQTKKKSKLFKELINFLEVENPLVPHKNILMFGPAGTGKTTMAEVVARHYNLPFAPIVGNARMEAEDFAGNITIAIDDEGDSSWVAEMTAFLQVAKAGGICFIDELLQIQGNTQASTNSMIFGSKRYINFQGKNHFVHPKTIFMAATNVGYEGVGHANFAFKDRFRSFKTEALTRSEIVDYYKSIFPFLKEAAITKYVDLCFDIDAYLESNYEDTDEYNLERPQLTVRRMNDMLGEMLGATEITDILHSTLSGIMNSPSFSDSDVQSVIDYFEKKIDDLDSALFANSAYSQEAAELAKDIEKLKRAPKKPKKNLSKATKVNKGNGKISLNLDDPNAWDDYDEDDEEAATHDLDVEDYENTAAPESPELFDDEDDDEMRKIQEDLDEADSLVEDLDK